MHILLLIIKYNKVFFYFKFQIDECVYSGLFKSFSQHILHRLHIYQYSNNVEKIRITFLSRETKYRNVLNEMELINSLKNFSDYDVRKVYFI